MIGRSIWRKRSSKELDPDEIFLDSRNLPSFDKQQFEGQMERPIAKGSLYVSSIIFLLVGVLFASRIGFLQIAEGSDFAERSNENKLRHTMIFSDRGIIYDRNGEELAWNDPDRVYLDKPGLAHVLGYVGYPNQEEISTGGYHPKSLIGKEGVERVYNSILAGAGGIKIEEVNALGEVFSDHVLREPESGDSLTISIDSRVQSAFYDIISGVAAEAGYVGGSGVIMDVETGEIISLVSYPEFNSTVMSEASDRAQINSYLTNPANPFLNRAVSGLYAPGSIMKPFVALAALTEGVISPHKQIVSTGQLVVPNPYNPDNPTIFKDWKAHGATDMRRAIAVSSDVYFYQVGGGFGSQPGLGIARIEKYARMFGFGAPTGINFPGEATGVIPNPEWKAANFDGEPWRLGNTYHTSIGQYGFLVSPLQAVRATAALANGGKLLDPVMIKLDSDNQASFKQLSFDRADLQVIDDGMRQAVVGSGGTAAAINVPYVSVAAKSGTAEVGINKEHINAWLVGFFPYEKPRYAFAVVMEKGRSGTVVGGGVVVRRLLDWMNQNTPEYFTVD